jgi:hypothetical protein
MNFKEKVIAERQELYKKKEVLEKELNELLAECRSKREEIEKISLQISQKYAILSRIEKKQSS